MLVDDQKCVIFFSSWLSTQGKTEHQRSYPHTQLHSPTHTHTNKFPVVNERVRLYLGVYRKRPDQKSVVCISPICNATSKSYSVEPSNPLYISFFFQFSTSQSSCCSFEIIFSATCTTKSNFTSPGGEFITYRMVTLSAYNFFLCLFLFLAHVSDGVSPTKSEKVNLRLER